MEPIKSYIDPHLAKEKPFKDENKGLAPNPVLARIRHIAAFAAKGSAALLHKAPTDQVRKA